MNRFQDRVDEMADRLGDAADTFREERRRILAELARAKDAFNDELLAAEDWAVSEGVIDSCEWRDEEGEPFLWVGETEWTAKDVPDLGTMFRERVAELMGEDG